MPRYDFRCLDCGTTFEVERPMAQASDPAPCPEGHHATVKLLNVFANVGGSGASAPVAPAPPRPAAGGCCGGGCHSH